MHTSTKWLIGMIVVMILSVTVLGATGFHFFLPYVWHKTLHVLGAVLLLGNAAVTGYWMFLAARTKKEEVIGLAVSAVHWADVFFTAPGAILLLVNGMVMAETWGGIAHTGWIQMGLGLFILLGIIWVLLLIPYQARMVQMAESAISEGEPFPDKFYSVLRKWNFWGSIATLLPLAILMIMVTKPNL